MKYKKQSPQFFLDKVEDFELNDVYELLENKSHVKTLHHVKSKIPW